jgi:hypothetical protein
MPGLFSIAPEATHTRPAFGNSSHPAFSSVSRSPDAVAQTEIFFFGADDVCSQTRLEVSKLTDIHLTHFFCPKNGKPMRRQLRLFYSPPRLPMITIIGLTS